MSSRQVRGSQRERSRTAWLRRALMERRRDLAHQVEGQLAYRQGARAGADFSDICDRAADAFHDEMAHGLAEIATADLRMIDYAIGKLDNRTYGLCEVCGRRIPEARLRALPFAELCVDCKRDEEAQATRLASHATWPPPPGRDEAPDRALTPQGEERSRRLSRSRR